MLRETGPGRTERGCEHQFLEWYSRDQHGSVTTSATLKAEKALKPRQSRLVCGLKKLKAKKMNTAEFRRTSSQRP